MTHLCLFLKSSRVLILSFIFTNFQGFQGPVGTTHTDMRVVSILIKLQI